MILPVYGVPVPLVIRWILEDQFPDGVGNWADLCCGNGHFVKSIGVIPREGIGVDVSENVPQFLQDRFTFHSCTIQSWLADNTKKFDLISLFGCVEHLEKEESKSLIKLSSATTDAMLIVTPNGFLQQDAESDPDLKDNPWQWHRCGFSPEEFDKDGWFVLVFRNYHLRPGMMPYSYDELCAFKKSTTNYGRLARLLQRKAFAYNMHPLHLFRTIRQWFRHRIPYPLLHR